MADFLSANPLLRADAAGTTTPGSPPGGSASQLKGRHVPHQLRASGSVCRRGCHQIPPWADMFGGWDVMIRGRIGDKESPAAGAVLPMLAASAALVQSAVSAADAAAGDDQGPGGPIWVSPGMASIRYKFRRPPKCLREHSETSSRRGFNVADAALEGPRPSVVSATPGRKLSLGVFKMPLRSCLPELPS